MEFLRCPGMDDEALEVMKLFCGDDPLNTQEAHWLRPPSYIGCLLQESRDYRTAKLSPNEIASKDLFNSFRQMGSGFPIRAFKDLSPDPIPLVHLKKGSSPTPRIDDFIGKSINAYFSSLLAAPEQRRIDNFIEFLHQSSDNVIVHWDSPATDTAHYKLAGPIRVYPQKVFYDFLVDGEFLFPRNHIHRVYYVSRPDFPSKRLMVGLEFRAIVSHGLALQAWYYYGHFFLRYYATRTVDGICNSSGYLSSDPSELYPRHIKSYSYLSTSSSTCYTWIRKPQFDSDGCIKQAAVLNNLNLLGIVWVADEPPLVTCSTFDYVHTKWINLPFPCPRYASVGLVGDDCCYTHPTCIMSTTGVKLLFKNNPEDWNAHRHSPEGHVGNWRYNIDHNHVEPEALISGEVSSRDPERMWRMLRENDVDWRIHPHNLDTIGHRLYTYFDLYYPASVPLNRKWKDCDMEWMPFGMGASKCRIVDMLAYNKHFGLPDGNQLP